MGCEICGRSSCTRVFHSIEEQNSFDDIADNIKNRAKEIISNRINRLDWEDIDGEVYVKLSDVINTVENYD